MVNKREQRVAILVKTKLALNRKEQSQGTKKNIISE